LDAEQVRARLVDVLRRDLIGPGPEDVDIARERLKENPSRWYLTGYLAPAPETAGLAAAEAAEALEEATGVEFEGEPTTTPRAKTMRQAMTQILLADVAMSLDNVLAVAGAAREHVWVLVVGLVLSIALMGLAATWIASLLQRHRWLGFAGLVIVLYVALHMIWQGHRSVVIDLGQTPAYNAAAPDVVDIRPEEEASRQALTGR
jgi:predicted tellurium resistance membrane protein TerC